MTKNYLLYFLTLVVCCCTWLSAFAQMDQDWADYHARYKKRVLLELNPSFVYTPGAETPVFNGVIPITGRYSRNVDRAITQFDFSWQNTLQHQDSEFSVPTYEAALNYNSQAYLKGKFFLGLELEGTANYLESTFTPGVFFSNRRLRAIERISIGLGRIEEAQDALLAQWIQQDMAALPEPLLMDAPTTVATAKTITDLIGNRTFDLRRRRIYELEQLAKQLPLDEWDNRSKLHAFTVLNDNWAFANRFRLQQGNQIRLAFGLEQFDEKLGGGFFGGGYQDFTQVQLSWRGGHIFPKRRLALEWLLSFTRRNFQPGEDFFGGSETWRGTNGIASLTLNHFPNSRNLLSLNVQMQQNEDPFPLFFSTGRIESNTTEQRRISLSWQHLFSYRWSIRFTTNYTANEQRFIFLTTPTDGTNVNILLQTIYAFQ